MATRAQQTMLARLGGRALAVAPGDEVACAWLGATDKRTERGGVDAGVLSNAEVDEVKAGLEHIIATPRCSHCHEPNPRGDCITVRYFDDVYGPSCGLS